MSASPTAVLRPEARIEDPDFYLADPYPLYARLRREDPVHLRADLGIWVLTRYPDVVAVSRQPVLFSCAKGFFLNDALSADSVANRYFAGSELISTVDPPRHNALRRVISPAFVPRRIAALEPFVRRTCQDLVARLPVAEPVEFVATVAEVLPLVVIGRLLGLRGDDVAEMARWSDELMKLGQRLDRDDRDASIAAFSRMNAFMQDQLARKRSAPAEDLLSTLLRAELDDETLSADNVLMWASVVLAGGNETTRALLGNAMHALGTHPEQLTALAEQPERASAAVEEVLRWDGPVLGFCRYVREDAELAGRPLRQGQWVYLLYCAANRDPEVFDDPEDFDITVPRASQNLAFGVGQHYCPGNLLARLEARVLLEELLARFRRWELPLPARRIRSTFRSGYLRLPVAFDAR